MCVLVTAVVGAALFAFAAPSSSVYYSDPITGLRVDAGLSPGPRLLVNPLVPACPNVTTDSCHGLPPHDAPMGWGSVRLCDVPWGPGPMQGEYYQWLPAFVKEGQIDYLPHVLFATGSLVLFATGSLAPLKPGPNAGRVLPVGGVDI